MFCQLLVVLTCDNFCSCIFVVYFVPMRDHALEGKQVQVMITGLALVTASIFESFRESLSC